MYIQLSNNLIEYKLLRSKKIVVGEGIAITAIPRVFYS